MQLILCLISSWCNSSYSSNCPYERNKDVSCLSTDALTTICVAVVTGGGGMEGLRGGRWGGRGGGVGVDGGGGMTVC